MKKLHKSNLPALLISPEVFLPAADESSGGVYEVEDLPAVLPAVFSWIRLSRMQFNVSDR
jgi:hypothetical protein